MRGWKLDCKTASVRLGHGSIDGAVIALIRETASRRISGIFWFWSRPGLRRTAPTEIFFRQMGPVVVTLKVTDHHAAAA